MYNLKSSDALEKLNSSKSGLNNLEIRDRLKKYGKNELEKEKKQTFLKSFFKQFLNIMVAILLVSAVVSLTVAIINKEYADLFEGFVILFIVIMNALIGVFQENKAQACINDLQKFEKTIVKVVRNGVVLNVDSTELVPGDIVEMEAGNIVMADIRLLESNNFSCDESSLTGESLPVEKNADLVLNKNTPLAERKNMAYSGSMVTNGKARGVVVATGKNTELGKIANLLFNAKKEITPLQKSIDKIGKIITWVVLGVCVIILAIELISGNGFMNAIMTSVALAVAAIPESLPAVITIILALGVQQLAKRKCIIKHLHAVETLGSCEVICTDKTGTLTLNKMQVVDTFWDNQFNLKQGEVYHDAIKCMLLCNNARQEKGNIVGEPTETALYEYAIDFLDAVNCKIIHEIPFNSTRKMMSVIVNDGGVKSYTKGAPEILIKKCKFIKLGDKILPFSDELKERVKNANDIMTDKALRVIAFCYKDYDIYNPKDELEEDMIFLGLAGMMDNPRPEVKDSIEKCFKAGLKPVMITGDHKRTAFAIAKTLGIASSIKQVITGEELDKLSDKELRRNCQNYTVYARVSPEHKVRIVKAFKGLKKIVAMTGDGVNDAPSLKIADIGVGMGKSGTDVVKNVADMVVTDDNFASIVVAVEEGRKVYSNIQKALQFLISTNCVEVFGMLLALVFFPDVTFLLPAQMLFINLVTDSLPAFALGMEKVEKDVMTSPPRDSSSGLFGGKVGVAIIYQSILQTLIVMIVFVVGIKFYSPNAASTMVFFSIIFMQLLHSVNCKTNNSIFTKNLFDNRTFNICFVVTLLINLCVACIPFMYQLFGLEFLNFSQWIVVIIASIIIIPTCELFKLVLPDRSRTFKIRRKLKTKI
ncbi:MAG TPA: cation-translocating P-type ATPase [Candidatus Onthoplasma faecigallinarum]|nr:cation-translocating P-type ATPase [Candidatus Onthoplasma faecigallinarum]